LEAEKKRRQTAHTRLEHPTTMKRDCHPCEERRKDPRKPRVAILVKGKGGEVSRMREREC